MPTFRCFIRGENFPRLERGRLKRLGFYTTRWVVAADEQKAELKAVAGLKKEYRSSRILCRRLKTMIFFEEVEEARKPPRPQRGATWFPM